MSEEEKPAVHAVIGATGQQGGAVVDALLARGANVRAIVRDAESERSRSLRARGVEVVAADQEDRRSLESAFQKITALFVMTTFGGADGTEGEVRRGTTIGDAAVAAQVPLVVYSSVGGAERATGIPHFDSKRQVEQHLQQVLPLVRIVRPTYFMENFTSSLQSAARDTDPFVLRMAVPADVCLQMVAVRDIGIVAASLMLDPESIEDDAIEIGGDELRPVEIAALIGEHFGRPARFEETPLEQLPNDDLRAMFRWFSDSLAYDADFATTRRLDPDALDLRRWLQQR